VIFTPTDLNGAFIVEAEPRSDDRGFYTRTWCAREFSAHGLNVSLAQSGLSYNRKRGTIRGMHMQAAPHAQTRLVRCARGAIYDVIIDLRPDSPTYCRWLAVELRGSSRAMLYVPEGFAHGFQTLEDDTEVAYHMSGFYEPTAERGVRWNDPRFAITWPLPDAITSDKDRRYRDFQP
jgi:dTDP-4-dehydrorhamnose 3,5-epimerase